MKKLIMVVVAIILLFVAFVIAGSKMLPDTLRADAGMATTASYEEVYAVVSDLKTWKDWTSWNTQNYPDMQYTYEGADSGPGAIMKWTDPSGNGRLEITGGGPATGIEFTLQFEGFAPMQGGIEFGRIPNGNTQVGWSVTGEFSGPIELWANYFMDFGSTITADFETGLQNLKARLEQ